MGLKQSLQIFTQVPNARGVYCCLADHSLSPCSLLSFCLCVFIKGLRHNTLLVMKTTCWHLKPFNIHMTLSIQRSTLDHISSIVWVCKQVSVTVSAGKKHGWAMWVCNSLLLCAAWSSRGGWVRGLSRRASGVPFEKHHFTLTKAFKRSCQTKVEPGGENINIVWVSFN